MCGFAGIWFHPPSVGCQALHESVSAMASAIEHRGPDDAGVWSDPQVGLAIAHKRLAVLDVSPAGHQPMCSASGRFVIAFNGEIYNHLSLREDIHQNWKGHSDTETFLAAVEAWGLQFALERCAGMFAFALWDREERKLKLVRDRFGEKPLYWGWLDQNGQRVFVFGSDLGALRACPGTATPLVDQDALNSFLRFGYVQSPLSIYSNIYQLLPGHYIEIDFPVCQQKSIPWWELAQHAAQSFDDQYLLTRANESEILDQLEQVLQHVVGELAVADVPLGTFLSGGVDSSLITALLQSVRSEPVRSFTIAFPDHGNGETAFNEAPFAASIASHLGTHHTEIPLTAKDALDLIPTLPYSYTEPFADSSQLPTQLLCREARRSGLTVALSGDGGDELFGGYTRHIRAPQIYKYCNVMPSVLRRTLANCIDTAFVRDQGLSRHKRNKLADAVRASSSFPDLYQALISLDHYSYDLLSTLSQDFKSAPESQSLTLSSAPTLAEQLMLADSMTYLPNDILVKIDRASMAASLETRAPFLDHRISAFAWQLPLALKLRDGVGKWALRQLLYRYVPRHLIERPKAGFSMPLGPWLRGPLRTWAEDLLDPALIRQKGRLNADSVQRLWQSHLAGNDHTPQLWSVLMWQAWSTCWLR